MRKNLLVSIVVLAVALAACGGADEGSTESTGATESTVAVETTETPDTTSAANTTVPASETTAADTTTGDDESASAGGPIIIQAANGAVTLDEPADRVVALEWAHGEMLLTLEVEPLAIADVEQYSVWIGAEPQPDEDVVDVGVRDEPSLEAISSFEPDLIVATETHEGIMDQLNEIAPTIRLKERPRDTSEGTYWEVVKDDFNTLAKATGTEEKAQEVLADVDENVAELKAGVSEAGLEGSTVAFASAWVIEGAPGMRIFTDNSFIWDSLDQLGLENAWDGEYVDWGFEGIEFEQLAQLPEDTHLVYTAPDDEGADPYTDVLPGNPFWDQLPFVTADRVYETEDEIWTFGGPRSFEQAAEGVVDALLDSE